MVSVPLDGTPDAQSSCGAHGYPDAMVWSRVRSGIVAVVAVAATGAALALSGALEERPEGPVPQLAFDETLETSRADIVVHDLGRGEEGSYVLTLTITSHLPVPMLLTDVVRLVDDEGRLALSGYSTTETAGASAAQPGVTDTFRIEYDPDREAVGDVAVEVYDATWTERDDTAFGLGSNMYDVELVAIVRLS